MVRRLRPADRCRRADAARRYPVAGSSRVSAPHPAAALSGALVLVQATPGPVLLGTGHGVIEALDADRAARADLLGLALPDVPLRLPLAVWAEEEHQILATTRGSVLPSPVRAGKHGRLPTHLRHGSITSTKLLRFWVTLASGSLARETDPARKLLLQAATLNGAVLFPRVSACLRTRYRVTR